jgi:tetratricopeptide (TPR) repeat protein
MLHESKAIWSVKHPIISSLAALSCASHQWFSLSLVLLLLLSDVASQSRQNAQSVKRDEDIGATATGQEKLPQPKQGMPIERDISSGEIHAYEVQLLSGQFAHFVIEQQGIDLRASLFDQDGTKAGESEGEKETKGRKDLLLLVKVTGSYRLEISSVDKAAVTGHYSLRIAQLRPAIEYETLTLKAKAFVVEAEDFEAKRIENMPLPLSRQQARPAHYFELSLKVVEKYEQALELWRRAADQQHVADTLYMIGQAYFVLGDFNKSRTYYEQSLQARDGPPWNY